MKKMVAIFTAVTAFTLAGSVQAQIANLAHSNQEAQAKASIQPRKVHPVDVNRVLLANLTSGNSAIMESTLEIITREKIEHPEMNFNSLNAVIDQIRKEGSTPALRYKAYLTKNVLTHPEWYVKKVRDTGEDGNIFFVAVGQRDHARLVAYGEVK